MRLVDAAMSDAFQVTDSWPNIRAGQALRQLAVRRLVANHTLIVGQSRSGKTTAARRIIEEILNWTEAQVVILDPNADFKLLGELGPKNEDAKFAKSWKSIAKDVEVATQGGAVWGISWDKLSLEEMAAFLRLRPKNDFAEYRHLDRHYKYTKGVPGPLDEFARNQYFDVAVGEDLERYRFLLNELVALEIFATSSTKRDLESVLAKGHKAVVVDLSMAAEEARLITAARTLEVLWKRGEELRRQYLQAKVKTPWPGTLVVIDEAHLFAPPETDDPRKRAVSERIQRFADQGKKLNLYLMVITQQPQKLHRGVLAEFSNRIIMRVNERVSLKVLEEMYGGLRGRYDGALTFNPGEALLEGELLCDEVPPPMTPRGAQFVPSRTAEGGGTPGSEWASPKRV